MACARVLSRKDAGVFVFERIGAVGSPAQAETAAVNNRAK
jgi:hypothetical protein